jgi:hypothetical protein
VYVTGAETKEATPGIGMTSKAIRE